MKNYVIEREVTGPLRTNTYLLYDKETKEAALFDVGGKIKKLKSKIEENDLKIKYIFCTHLHFDHVQGVGKVRERHPEAKLAFHDKDFPVLEGLGPFARMFEFKPKSLGNQDISIEDGDTFKIGGIEVKALLTPGHSPGSICFYFDDKLISGDVLFKQGIGRTDLFGGSYETILNSLSKLYEFPDSTIVYPGHGEFTNIKSEKNDNPFFSIHDI